MTHHILHLTILNLILSVHSERWSRQIKNDGNTYPEEINDWIPLTRLTDERLKDKIYAAPQEIHQRYVLQPNENPTPTKATVSETNQNQDTGAFQNRNFHHHQQPQSFFKFEMPTLVRDDGIQQANLPTVQTGYQIQHSFPQQALFAAPFLTYYQNEFQQLISPKIAQQNSVENFSPRKEKDKLETAKSTKLAANIQYAPINPNLQVQRPTPFQTDYAFQNPSELALQAPKDEEVQLLYVPYDSIYNRNEKLPLNGRNSALITSSVSPEQINNFYTPKPIPEINENGPYSVTPFSSTPGTLRPSTTYNAFLNPHFTTPSPSKPTKTKLKPHQPPLSLFALRSSDQPNHDVNNILRSLTSSKSIAVLDSLVQQPPSIFIGPANLPIPPSYIKHELPYLSSIGRNYERDMHKLSFFVAPLSYKAPDEFTKIILPEPHVGSIVVHKPFSVQRPVNIVQQQLQEIPSRQQVQQQLQEIPTRQQQQLQEIPTRQQQQLQEIPTRQQHLQQQLQEIPTRQQQLQEIPTRQQQLQEFSNRQQAVQHQKSQEIPSRLQHAQQSNKPYYITPSKTDPIREVTPKNVVYQNNYGFSYPEEDIQNFKSTKIKSKTRKNQSNLQKQADEIVQQYNNANHQFPSIHQYTEETFRTSPVTESSSTSSAAPTLADATKSSTQQVNNLNSYYEPSFNKDFYGQRYNSKPKEDIRAHSGLIQSSTPHQGKVYENVQYVPVSLDYEQKKPQQYISSSTPSYYPSEASTLKSTTPRELITFYTPSPVTQDIESDRYNYQDVSSPYSVQKEEQPIVRTTTPTTYYNQQLYTQQTNEPIRNNNVIPINHRPEYDNRAKDHESKYDENSYKLPTELPALTSNLPGLVNALIEKERLNALEKGKTTEQLDTTTATTPPTISSTSLRPFRNRANQNEPSNVKVSSSTSVSYSTSSNTGRRVINRGRRPYNPRNNNSSSTDNINNRTSTTATTTRSSIVRNPNRIRYNPTPEERRQFRTRTKVRSSTPRVDPEEEYNIDYQRDVLKQNYPVFNVTLKRRLQTTTETSPITEQTTKQITRNQNIVTVTPSDEQQHYDKDAMNFPKPEAYEQQSPNYGPGYFPNPEDEIQTTPITNTHVKNEVLPEHVEETTKIEKITRKPAFVRRPSKLAYLKHSDAPQTTTTTVSPTVSEERYTVRSRKKPQNISDRPYQRRVVKIRSRFRKVPQTTTQNPDDDRQSENDGYQDISGFNREFLSDRNSEISARNGQKSIDFNLETQESNWSPLVGHMNSFNPVDPSSERKLSQNNDDSKKFENEPDIMTAAPNAFESESLSRNQNVFLFNVSGSFGSTSPTSNVYGDRDSKSTKNNTSIQIEPIVKNTTKESYNHQHYHNYEQQHKTKTIDNKKQSKDNYSNENESNKKIDNVSNDDSALTTTIITDSSESNNKKLNDNNENVDHENTTFKDSKQAPTSTGISSLQQSTKGYVTTTSATDTVDNTAVNNVTGNYDNESSEIVTDMITKRSDEKYYDNDDDGGDIHDDRNNNVRHHNHRENEEEIASAYDLESQPSLFDEVRKQLTNLFAIDDNDNEDNVDNINLNFKSHKQNYVTINRTKELKENQESESHNNDNENVSYDQNTDDYDTNDDGNKNYDYGNQNNKNRITTTTTVAAVTTTIKQIPTITTTDKPVSRFHKNLMRNIVYATSTPIDKDDASSQETEICYRGRCVKAAKQN